VKSLLTKHNTCAYQKAIVPMAVKREHHYYCSQVPSPTGGCSRQCLLHRYPTVLFIAPKKSCGPSSPAQFSAQRLPFLQQQSPPYDDQVMHANPPTPIAKTGASLCCQKENWAGQSACWARNRYIPPTTLISSQPDNRCPQSPQTVTKAKG
jgi:hypothetical protein